MSCQATPSEGGAEEVADAAAQAVLPPYAQDPVKASLSVTTATFCSA